jgi:hypothetical protein
VFFGWHKWIKVGHENVEDDERSDHPRSHRSDENVEEVKNMMHSGRRLCIRAVAMLLNLDKETVKRPEHWPSVWVSTMTCTSSQGALSNQFLTQKLLIESEHPQVPPVLSPNDFWLFQKIKPALKGRRFQVIGNIRKM